MCDNRQEESEEGRRAGGLQLLSSAGNTEWTCHSSWSFAPTPRAAASNSTLELHLLKVKRSGASLGKVLHAVHVQVVHHLFPAVCHTHYPAIAPIVIETCKEYNVPYRIYPTVRQSPHSCSVRFSTLFQLLLCQSVDDSADDACTSFLCTQFVSAIKAHFAHLKSMGSETMMVKVPSLATIG